MLLQKVTSHQSEIIHFLFFIQVAKFISFCPVTDFFCIVNSVRALKICNAW